MSKRDQEQYSSLEEDTETSDMPVSNHAPKKELSKSATDPLADFVEGTMDNIQHTFDSDGGSKKDRSE
ncbi:MULTISPECIES: hypothetical protein [Paenibacillus]|uniref:hypothetical protein n=1 Tax=Paenibacillus TaxID=44249 RepID=UPI0022B92ECC|nr:hypothetical protein [Paenibacillus caseinilyticus]MCZ8518135.1 hypothetical protein [Paenibacillus caseinilyticus]